MVAEGVDGVRCVDTPLDGGRLVWGCRVRCVDTPPDGGRSVGVERTNAEMDHHQSEEECAALLPGGRLRGAIDDVAAVDDEEEEVGRDASTATTGAVVGSPEGSWNGP